MTGRLLGIDHGLKRIGIAVSDVTGLVARELAIIQRTTNQADFARLHHIIQEQRVSGVVIGLPFNPEAGADDYTQSDTVRRWVERFRPTIAIPITLWDEQLTSQDARELSIRLRRDKRAPIDDLAARVMLQSYLDAVREGLVTLPGTPS